MKVLYVSTVCSLSCFNDIFHHSRVKPRQEAQKYHRLMIEGLAANPGVEVDCLSALPLFRAMTSRWFFPRRSETEAGIRYTYAPFVNAVILRHLFLFVYALAHTIAWCHRHKDGVVVCDVLNLSVSAAALLASRLMRTKCVGLVTDIPGFMVDGDRAGAVRKLLRRAVVAINTFTIHHFGYYVFLTAHMNTLVNRGNRPYVVIEGQVDVKMARSDNSLAGKYRPAVCMYTGALHRRYGVDRMVEGFLEADVDDAELHIYGTGPYEEELAALCRRNPRVKYFGVAPNDVIVREQLKAMLLINPRPTNEAFTKYSFPSKNMEYLASGTPVLTTDLPGMPPEYRPYVYLIDAESAPGIAAKIAAILSERRETLHAFGIRAKEFVLSEKSNVQQAAKVLKMVSL